MEKSIKMLFDAFQATFAVSTQMRPDGGALLTLRNGEEIVTRRVVSAAQLADEKRMYWFINAVRRDLALEAGSLPVDVVGTLRRLQERGLPSLHGGLNGSSGILAETSGRAGESARVKLRGLGEDRPAPLVSEGRPGLACPFGASAGWRRTMQGRSGQHQG